eukprot:GHVN01011274.1.p1 GENE.GHVN01011274.1~~GHVN01011274.1.p1  ORF type:complete len:521 (+),score=118.27 GHVN01011274.1:46-1608(+)
MASFAEFLNAKGQAHLIPVTQLWSTEEQQALREQLQAINVERQKKVFDIAISHSSGGDRLKVLAPTKVKWVADDASSTSPHSLSWWPSETSEVDFMQCVLTRLSEVGDEVKNRWRMRGLQFISDGKLGLVMMGGGQGTRLGYDKPKGAYPISPISGKSLYQTIIERVLCLRKLVEAARKDGLVTYEGSEVSEVSIPFLVMTSGATDKETHQFLEQNDYFGYNSADLHVFEQPMIAACNLTGGLLIGPDKKLVMSPNGNGGIFAGIEANGMLGNLKSRGVEAIHVFGVDNVLCKGGDPSFIGYCVESGAPCGNKCVRKEIPTEPIGVFCRFKRAEDESGFKCGVVEYSELSKELAEARHTDGSLSMSAGNIANHYFTISFIDALNQSNSMDGLYHVAEKKVPCLGDDGEVITPTSPNAIKLELFIFDSFLSAQRVVGLEVERNTEFAPLKNKEGNDSPTTARALMSSLHQSYLTAAGAKFNKTENKDAYCEISSLITYEGEGLERYVPKDPIDLPFHLTGA